MYRLGQVIAYHARNDTNIHTDGPSFRKRPTATDSEPQQDFIRYPIFTSESFQCLAQLNFDFNNGMDESSVVGREGFRAEAYIKHCRSNYFIFKVQLGQARNAHSSFLTVSAEGLDDGGPCSHFNQEPLDSIEDHCILQVAAFDCVADDLTMRIEVPLAVKNGVGDVPDFSFLPRTVNDQLLSISTKHIFKALLPDSAVQKYVYTSAKIANELSFYHPEDCSPPNCNTESIHARQNIILRDYTARKCAIAEACLSGPAFRSDMTPHKALNIQSESSWNARCSEFRTVYELLHNSSGRMQTSTDIESRITRMEAMFYSSIDPSISLEKYVNRLARFLALPSYVYVVAFIYINRLKEYAHLSNLCAANTHRIILSALFVSARILTPHLEQVNAKHFGHVGGTSEEEMTRLADAFACLIVLREMKIGLRQVGKKISDGSVPEPSLPFLRLPRSLQDDGFTIQNAEFIEMIQMLHENDLTSPGSALSTVPNYHIGSLSNNESQPQL